MAYRVRNSSLVMADIVGERESYVCPSCGQLDVDRRAEDIAEAKAAGATFAELAERLLISKQGVCEALQKYMRRRETNTPKGAWTSFVKVGRNA